MKLATYDNGARDGCLMLVSRDLTRACAAGIVPTLQAALDHWDEVAPVLEADYRALNRGECDESRPFDPVHCLAPLPRAYQWADGSAYPHHVESVRRARGVPMPERYYDDPLLYQGGSDCFLPPLSVLELADPAWGLDFEAEVAVITSDVAQGADPAHCAQAIRLLMLVNDWSLRELIPAELAKGFGFFQGKPACSASPLAVTPDEAGAAWRDGRLHLPMQVELNGQRFGHVDAGAGMHFPFPRLLAHAARTRRLSAGTVLGGGSVSSPESGSGECCLIERRMRELMEQGAVLTPYLRPGDRIRIEMLDAGGGSVFGAMEQLVVASRGAVKSPPANY
ncbi:fumarylacetoacetate hydrolase family protein [Paludibacterium yongneupense]|uniref:fumarylacetoacetate hydrolase family protein n=1 Tax=Paludibacterium yongneupense TaxID=400061 RepID=UPI0004270BAE|nr:fumarylacetoacetate hydrolase family protein [Paludibacterium yongneupense]